MSPLSYPSIETKASFDLRDFLNPWAAKKRFGHDAWLLAEYYGLSDLNVHEMDNHYPNQDFNNPNINPVIKADAFRHTWTAAVMAYKYGFIGRIYGYICGCMYEIIAGTSPAQQANHNMDYWNNRIGFYYGSYARANGLSFQDLDQLILDGIAGNGIHNVNPIVEPWKDWHDSNSTKVAGETTNKYTIAEHLLFLICKIFN